MNLSVSHKRLLNTDAASTTGPTIMALLMDDGKIYAYAFGHWYRTNEEPTNPVAVAVGPGGFWCLDRVGNIHRWNEKPADSEWVKDSIVDRVIGLTCDTEGNLWCINKDGDLYISSLESPTLDGKMPQQVRVWSKAGFESAWFFRDTWEYTAQQGDHLLKIVRSQYKVTDTDTVYQIADEIVRLSKISKKRDSIKAGQMLTMPPFGYR
jgi:hypothetical protein